MKKKTPKAGGYAGRRGIHSKSSATQVQYQRILALLAIRPHSTEDLRKAGIFQVSARIKELRGMGHPIITDRITMTDRDGFAHHGVALYSLGGV
ncbi:Helix-turn-helix domain-containing protein OS=Castellaniella sp OX=1955812 GN=EPN31_12155 PE=4 SV=1 [Castellaniella denitrificans]